MVVHGGERGRDDLGDLRVVYARDHHLVGHAVPVLAQAREGAVGDGVGGADDAVELGVLLQEGLRLLVAGVNRELGHAHRALGDLDPCLGAGGEKALAAHLAHGDVLLEDADVGGALGAAQRYGGNVVHGIEVVLEHAGAALHILIEHHHRHGEGGDGCLVLGRDHGGYEDDAVHLILL